MLGIALDRLSRRPLAVQLAEALRERIMDGSLVALSRLPASRVLAEELSVARGVVVEAYEQLEAEGYLAARRGIGAFVASGLGSKAAESPRGAPGPGSSSGKSSLLVSRLPPDSAVNEGGAPREEEGFSALRRGPRWDFTPGIPDLASFPRRAWARLVTDACVFGADRDFSYGESAGDQRLRAALCSYLIRLRGLRVRSERLFLTAGTSSALQSLALFFRSSRFFFEDPGLPFAREAFAAAGSALFPLDVDGEGAVPPPPGFIGGPAPDLAYLTPSHQFPTGVLMPIGRRLKFVREAEAAGAFIVEDDYDAEFRFQGAPVPPIASIAIDSTIYLGSFSKTLAPFLRVGWMVLPPRLVEGWRVFVRSLNLRGSSPVQRSLAFMLETGAYDRHIAAMRRLYRRRRDRLIAALVQEFGAGIAVREGHTGFHLTAALMDRPIREEEKRALRAAGLSVSFGGEFRFLPAAEERELVLGYGNIDEGAIDEGVRVLARTLHST
jgi:GntR family transcriptional regulator/MocR family aminotransferase